MFSLKNIVLPSLVAGIMPFLNDYGIEFGQFTQNIQGKFFTLPFIVVGFILVLFFENSNKKLNDFKFNLTNSLIFVCAFTISFYKLSGYSEFLYFRF
jgi:hypothetical protein